jgi:hypothetical protein
VTVTATVFAMQYAVLEDDTTFSPGGIAGIVIGCALGLGGLLGAFLGLRRVRQRKQSLARIESELRGGEGAVPGSSVVPISSQYTPFRPRSPPSPGGKTEEVKLPHGEMTPKAAVRAAELLASRLRLEPIKEVPSDPSSRVATLARRYQDPPDHPKATHTFAYPGSTIRATPVRFYDKPVPAPSPNPPRLAGNVHVRVKSSPRRRAARQRVQRETQTPSPNPARRAADPSIPGSVHNHLPSSSSSSTASQEV